MLYACENCLPSSIARRKLLGLVIKNVTLIDIFALNVKFKALYSICIRCLNNQDTLNKLKEVKEDVVIQTAMNENYMKFVAHLTNQK